MSLLLLFTPHITGVAITNNVNTTVTHLGGGIYEVEKTSGASPAYNANAISSTGFAGNFVLRIKPLVLGVDQGFGGGMDPSPATSASYDAAYLLLYNPPGNQWHLYESGAFVTNFNLDTYAWIWRTGTTLYYGVGNSLAAAQAAPARSVTTSATLYFDSTFAETGQKLEVYLYEPASSVYTVDIQALATPSPSMVRSTGRSMQGTSTPSPTLVRANGKPLQATSTPASTLLRANAKVLQTSSTPVPTLVPSRQASRSLQGQSTPQPSIVKATGKQISRATTPAPSLVRNAAKILQVTSTPAGQLTRAMTRIYQVQSTPAPRLARETGKTLRASSTPASSLAALRTFGRSLQATSTPVPTNVRASTRTLQGSTAPTPSLYRLTSKALIVSSVPAPSIGVSRQYLASIQAQTTPGPSMSQQKVFLVSIQAMTGGVASGGTAGPRVTATFMRP